MKTKFTKILFTVLAVWLLTSALCLPVFAQGTAFTYQGRLNDGGNPAGGMYDLRFSLYDSLTTGTQQGSPLTNAATSVSNGLFTVTLDFGAGVFTGADRWLEIGVRTNGNGTFSPLSARQKITPTPYATYASFAAGASVAGSLGGFSASSFWNIGGNADTTPGKQFLGTADDQPLELKVNNQRALRLEPNPNAPNVIGGSPANEVTNGLYGAVIAGGGSAAYPNRVGAIFGTVVGGAGNTASGNFATAMGQFNTASGYASTALGYSTVAGGFGSQAGGTLAKANHDGAFVWADNNFADFTSTAVNQFLIRAAGGVGINNNNPNGAALAVNGNVSVAGILNTASLTTPQIGTPASGPLELRANGQLGLRLDSAGTAANLTAPGNLSFGAQTRQMLNLFNADYGIGVQTDTTYFRTRGNGFFTPAGNFTWFAGGQHSDTTFDPGPPSPTGSLFESPREMMRLDGTGQLTVYGSTGNGVQGISTSAGASAVYAENLSGGGFGVAGRTTGTGNAVYGDNANAAGWAGNFNGRVFVGGNQHFGTQTRQMLNLYNASYGIGVQANTLYFRTDNSSPINGGFAWYQGGVHNDGQQNAGGGTPLMTLNGNELNVLGGGSIEAGRIFADDRSIGAYGHHGYAVHGETDGPGSAAIQGVNSAPTGWAGLFTGRVSADVYITTSDRNVKTHFEPVSARDILAKVAALPITRWNFTNDLRTAHMGPVAQDFKAAFDLGSDDKGIATVDADGVALAAIQGLNQKVEDLNGELKRRDTENAELKQRLEKLERLMNHKLNGGVK